MISNLVTPDMIDDLAKGKNSIKQSVCLIATFISPGIDRFKISKDSFLKVDRREVNSAFYQLMKAGYVRCETGSRVDGTSYKRVHAYPTEKLNFEMNKEQLMAALVFLVRCHRLGMRTMYQVKFLAFLDGKKDVTQDQTFHGIGIIQSSLTAMANFMGKLGLVETTRIMPKDERGWAKKGPRTFYNLTEKGRKLLTVEQEVAA